MLKYSELLYALLTVRIRVGVNVSALMDEKCFDVRLALREELLSRDVADAIDEGRVRGVVRRIPASAQREVGGLP